MQTSNNPASFVRHVPSLTILVPTKNSERTIGRCLESLLKSTCQDFQLILIDGRSTDKTMPIAQYYYPFFFYPPITFVQPENTYGKQKGINDAFKLIKTDYFLITDSDDELEEDAISFALSTWKTIKNSNVYSVRGRIRFASTGKMDGDPYPENINEIKKTKAIKIDYHSGFDKVDFFKTELFRTFLFPENKYVTDVSESVVFKRHDNKYNVFFSNKVMRTYYYEKAEVSLSKPTKTKQYYMNRLFFYSFFLSHLNFYHLSFLEIARLAKQYIVIRKTLGRSKSIKPVIKINDVDAFSRRKRFLFYLCFGIFVPFFAAEEVTK